MARKRNKRGWIVKYQGNIAQVEAVQKAIQATKYAFLDKRTGWKGEAGIEPSSLYRVRLIWFDNSGRTLKEWAYYISFEYEQRDDKAELWIKDEDTGRLIKVFPQVLPLLGQLTPIKLPEAEAQIAQEKYRMNQILRRSEM